MDVQAESEMPLWAIILIPIAFFVIFPIFWCFVIWILSKVSGWNRLAKHYRAHQIPEGTAWTGLHGMLGSVSYKQCLDCTASKEGLFLQPGILFRFAHPLLFIPWSDFHDVRRTSMLWIPIVRADIGDSRPVRLRLSAKVFEESEGQKLLPPKTG